MRDFVVHLQALVETGLVPLLVAAGIAMAVAGLGGLATDLGPWYVGLAKPWWQPPGWFFGPAWTLIFALTALAAASAWIGAPDGGARQLLAGAFAVNAVLNILWSVLFFTFRRPDWALIELVGLWLSIVVLIVLTARSSAYAPWLLAPYLAWVGFAGVLNWTILRLNPVA